jgi:hypothetical protein
VQTGAELGADTMESKAFYTAAVAILLALFVAIAVPEGNSQREVRKAGLKTPPGDRWRLVVVLALAAACLIGGICALYALRSTPVPSWTELPLEVCMLVAVLSALALALDAFLAQAALVLPTVLVIVVGVGAVVYVVVKTAKPQRLSGPYVVGGTCADLACRLRQHIAPRLQSPYSEVPPLRDGSRVYVRCQILGGPVYLRHGHGASIVWDYLKDKRYVSDLFLNTANYGRLDPSIPLCPEYQNNPYIGEHPHS